ncbi:MAG: hypothetical protein JJE07_12155 [Flavobacteriaceae bacterium]|nr:hypothetical protein [Flavobacteriaceae bacterium]
MSTALSTSSFSDTCHKMDNILYEIRDSKGIPNDKYYEPWKEEILKDLKISGFIVQNSDLYVLTKAGREVIKNVSFKVYNQKIKSGTKETEQDLQKSTQKRVLKFWFLLLVFAQLFIFMCVLLYRF